MSSESLHTVHTTEDAPINANERFVSYAGVRLEKAENTANAPKKEHYADYIDDDFSIELQKKIAVSFLQGEPILVEGGTSIGKTTTVRKMCADLGWEVHYANLNGATDVEDLMGRYIPNPQKNKEGDPEYVFADGKVTSGLRQEKGKTKVVILDELNATAPNILIRLHEVLDALERDGEVVLSEDASEVINVNKGKTKVIALMNPPGKGYQQRETMDPAQLRRWVYQKEATELPKETLQHATEALFGLAPRHTDIPKDKYLVSNEEGIPEEQLSEIEGMKEMTAKYVEFHRAAKELVAKRKVGQDQPQPFTFDDRMEPRRIRNFMQSFYRGDLTKTFQDGLRFYYAGKLLSSEDKEKMEELIRLVEYTPMVVSKRKGLDAQQRKFEHTRQSEHTQQQKFLGISGAEIEPTSVQEYQGYKVGDKLRVTHIPGIRKEIRDARELTIVGFTSDNRVVIQVDEGVVVVDPVTTTRENFEVIQTGTEERKKEFTGINGKKLEVTSMEKYMGYTVGDKLLLKKNGRSVISEIKNAQELEVVGFTAEGNNIVIQIDNDRVAIAAAGFAQSAFDIIQTGTEEWKKVFTGLDGNEVVVDDRMEADIYKIGDELTPKVGVDLRSEVRRAKKLIVAGFTSTDLIVLQLDGNRVATLDLSNTDVYFNKVEWNMGGRKKEESRSPGVSRAFFTTIDGSVVFKTETRELKGYKIGDYLKIKEGKSKSIRYKAIKVATSLRVAGFTAQGRVIVQADSGEGVVAQFLPETADEFFVNMGTGEKVEQ